MLFPNAYPITRIITSNPEPKKQQEYHPLLIDNKKEFERQCADINEATYCFDNWELTVSNLTDKMMSAIDD